jgi:starch phosphorylase
VRDGRPVTIKVPIWDEEVAVNIWRVDVGRVALLLLDTGLSENNARQRFITARLYEANREIRLAQYALLGVGGVRALEALASTPPSFT